MKKQNSIEEISQETVQKFLKSFVSIKSFSKKLNVNRSSVYDKIEQGIIIPIYIGEDKTPLIDFEKYKLVTFRKKTNIS